VLLPLVTIGGELLNDKALINGIEEEKHRIFKCQL